MAKAAEIGLDFFCRKGARERQRADHLRAGGLGLHHPAGGGPAAQGVEHQRGDGGAILGAGEAMRQAPVFQAVGGGTAARLEVFEDLDGCGDAGGGMHGDLFDFFSWLVR